MNIRRYAHEHATNWRLPQEWKCFIAEHSDTSSTTLMRESHRANSYSPRDARNHLGGSLLKATARDFTELLGRCEGILRDMASL